MSGNVNLDESTNIIQNNNYASNITNLLIENNN